jgi:hypothetical protein
MNRPYCLKELSDIERGVHERFRIGDVFAEHLPCKHRYRVKRGGRKEQFAGDGIMDEQTCSVCFKLRTSSDDITTDLIEEMKELNVVRDIEFTMRKHSFYKWLYQHNYN